MVLASSVVEVFGFSRLINPDCSVTSTVCSVAAGDSVKLTVAVCPTETLVGCDCAGTESLGMDLNPIGPRIHLAEEKTPVCVALDDAHRAGIHFGCLDLSVGNHGATLVRNGPG